MSRLKNVSGTLGTTTARTNVRGCDVVNCPRGRGVFTDLLKGRGGRCVGDRVGRCLKDCCGDFGTLRGVGSTGYVRTHVPFSPGVRWVTRKEWSCRSGRITVSNFVSL